MVMKRLTRSRWAAIGAAVAVTLGGGGLIGVSAATVDTDQTLSTVEPVRILDTRGGDKVSYESYFLKVTGEVATYTSSGTVNATVVPDGASAVSMNLTVTEGVRNANGYGFVTAFPCTAITDTAPDASTINFVEGVDVANSTVVPIGSTGYICLNVYGDAHLVVDVNGFYEDMDAYTKGQADSKFFTKVSALTLAEKSDAFPKNPIVMSYGNSLFNGLSTNAVGNQGMIPTAGRATAYKGSGNGGQKYYLPLVGPIEAGTEGHQYSPYTTVVCFGAITGSVDLAILSSAGVSRAFVGTGLSGQVAGDRDADGCLTIKITEADLLNFITPNRMDAFILALTVEGDNSEAIINSVRSWWYDQYNNPQ